MISKDGSGIGTSTPDFERLSMILLPFYRKLLIILRNDYLSVPNVCEQSKLFSSGVHEIRFASVGDRIFLKTEKTCRGPFK